MPLLRAIHRLVVSIHNVIVFVECVTIHAIPPWRWGEAWRGMHEAHRAKVHKDVWELKKQGRIREDENGGLWPND